jgi:putative membrane protein
MNDVPAATPSVQSSATSASPPRARAGALRFERVEIGLLYFLMFAGALWHVLNVLQAAMSLLAAPMVILLALWLAYRYDQHLRLTTTTAAGDEGAENLAAAPPGGLLATALRTLKLRSATARFHVWNVLVVVGCYWIEFIGVKTGVIFGEYGYTGVWVPAYKGVPFAIGFAWLGMLLSSFACMQAARSGALRETRFAGSPALQAAFVAAQMTIFDIFMEPVAVKLHYWGWAGQSAEAFFVAPFQNYAAWFAIGYALAFLALRAGLFQRRMPRVAFHAYWAQLLYFAMIAFGKSS